MSILLVAALLEFGIQIHLAQHLQHYFCARVVINRPLKTTLTCTAKYSMLLNADKAVAQSAGRTVAAWDADALQALLDGQQQSPRLPR